MIGLQIARLAAQDPAALTGLGLRQARLRRRDLAQGLIVMLDQSEIVAEAGKVEHQSSSGADRQQCRDQEQSDYEAMHPGTPSLGGPRSAIATVRCWARVRRLRL